jgi:hypothetical protein
VDQDVPVTVGIECRCQLDCMGSYQVTSTQGNVQVVHARGLSQFLFVLRKGLAFLAQIDHEGVPVLGHGWELVHVDLSAANHGAFKDAKIRQIQG